MLKPRYVRSLGFTRQPMNYCVHEDELLPRNCLGQPTQLDRLVANKAANTRRSWKCGLGTVVFLIIACVVIIFCRNHVEELLNWLDELPRWQSGFIFVGLFTLISLPGSFGYLILNVAAGYMYGFWLGMLIVFISVAVGSLVSFLLMRISCVKNIVQKQIDFEDTAWLRRIVEGKNGLKIIALARFTPIPFGLQNAAFALTNVSLLKYMLATVIGLLPTQAINTYLGTTVRSMKDVVSNDGDSYVMFTFQLLASIVLMIFVIRLGRAEINKCAEVSYGEKDLEAGDGHKKGHSRSKSASAILMSKQKIINQPSQFR